MERIDELKCELEEVREEEQDAYDNLPESIQYSEKGETMESNIDEMDNAISSLEDAISSLESAEN